MASETTPPDGAQRGIGEALRRAYQLPRHDAEAEAERHELRKLEIKQALTR